MEVVGSRSRVGIVPVSIAAALSHDNNPASRQVRKHLAALLKVVQKRLILILLDSVLKRMVVVVPCVMFRLCCASSSRSVYYITRVGSGRLTAAAVGVPSACVAQKAQSPQPCERKELGERC